MVIVSIYYREGGFVVSFNSVIAYYTPVESFPHIFLRMSGPGNVFFLKTPLLLCTIKYFISLTCIDLKNSLNESMLFNFFLKKSQLGFESIENINIYKIMTLLVRSFFLALKYKFSHIEVPEENESLVLIIYSLF